LIPHQIPLPIQEREGLSPQENKAFSKAGLSFLIFFLADAKV